MMLTDELEQWELEYREAARRDKYAVLKAHLKEHGLPNKPKLLLEGTILVVQICAVYLEMDGIPFTEFLRAQRYVSSEADDARYAITFSLHGRSFARVLVPRNVRKSGVDFADLYGHPWDPYEICGYDAAWISRLDGKNLSKTELTKLEAYVEYDLRFDYCEDELDFWFDNLTFEGKMMIAVQDHVPSEDDVSEEEQQRRSRKSVRAPGFRQRDGVRGYSH